MNKADLLWGFFDEQARRVGIHAQQFLRPGDGVVRRQARAIQAL